MCLLGPRRAARLLLLLLLIAGCDAGTDGARGGGTGAEAPTTAPKLRLPDDTDTHEARKVENAVTAPAPVATPASVARALARLEGWVRPAAGVADNPWALGHGLLAFGRDFTTTDGGAAVTAIMANVVPIATGNSAPLHGFPRTTPAGVPAEPHPHALVLAMLSAGVPRAAPHATADGSEQTLDGLIADVYANADPASLPTELDGQDARWHAVAWRLAIMALEDASPEPKPDPARRAAFHRLRARCLDRLERDLQPFLPPPPAGDPFAATAPLGAAKRNKSHLYGHSCGGLHFVDAVLRSYPVGEGVTEATPEATTAATAATGRVSAALGTLPARFDAERVLYARTLASHPAMALVLTTQQLKFFGHLLEVLGRAADTGYRNPGQPGAEALAQLEPRVVAELVATVDRLDALGAYGRLPSVRREQRQTYLDLIGDGCHAVAALRAYVDRQARAH